MEIKVTAEVRLPRPPNFLRYGDADHQTMDVKDLSVEDLKNIGKAWTDQLVEHALKRRKDHTHQKRNLDRLDIK